MIEKRLLLIGVVILLVVSPLLAQDTRTYVSTDGPLTFDFPESWEISERDLITITSEDFTLLIYGSAYASTFGLDKAASVADAIAILLPDAADIEVTEMGERTVASAPYTNPQGTEGMYFIVRLNDGSLRVLNAFNAEGTIATFQSDILSLIETMRVIGRKQPSEAEAEAMPETVTLEQHDGDWQDAVAELETLGLIDSGGSLIFRENRAFFSGQGNWFTPLASGSPRTDIVMAGELAFTPDGDEVEFCSLSSRINAENGSSSIYLDVGVDSSGVIYYYDLFDGDSTGDEARIPDFDLSVPHHFLLLALDDRLTVFVDGEMIFENAPIVERDGFYGVSLLGDGPGSFCEATNIWAYEAPSYPEGVCEISAPASVNKRSGPGTNFDVAGQLNAGQTHRAAGQSVGADGFTWWQLDDESWVRDDVINAQGDCRSVPVVE